MSLEVELRGIAAHLAPSGIAVLGIAVSEALFL